jgi:hypothetical protein
MKTSTALNSMTGMECTHSIPAGMEWSFHSCWSGIITFPMEWKVHFIPAGMECHSRPSLKKYAAGLSLVLFFNNPPTHPTTHIQPYPLKSSKTAGNSPT